MNFSYPLIVAFLSSLCAVHWIYFKILRIAIDKNIVDIPNARKLQRSATPVMGGVAVFFGVVVGLFAGLLCSCQLGYPLSLPMYTLFCSMVIMLYIGAVDDILGLSPRTRFVIEILVVLSLICGSGGCLDSFHGLWGIYDFSWWIGVPLTVFCCVGIINAVNMIDGINGLSSGLCIFCNLCFGYSFIRCGSLNNAIINITMAASLIPFLVHNVLGRRSKMFIGDAGTMVMGVIMSWDIIQILRSDTTLDWLQNRDHQLSLVAMALAFLAVPVWDTLRVMTLRIYHGHSPFQADRTHLHHVLYKYSVSHSLTALIEISANVLIVLLWVLSYKLHLSLDVQLYIVVLSSFLVVWGGYYYLTHGERRHTNYAYRLRRAFAASRQGDKDWWNTLQRFVDGEESESSDLRNP